MALHYRELEVWQRARELIRAVYEATQGFPREELFGLTSQMRRAAISIASNIAEGSGRATTKEYIRFLYIARGSIYELETQVVAAGDLGLLASDQADATSSLLAECARMLQGLIRSLESKTDNQTRG